MSVNPRRIFAGARARDLRRQLGLNLSTMAARIGISVSYLSQIESDDRPMTDAVLIAFARAFPGNWADLSHEQDVTLLAQATMAARDPAISGSPVDEETIRRAIKRQPELAQRLVATHDAYQRSQFQLSTLDDALDRGGRETPLPWEEVRDWFHARGNYIDALDRAAEQIAEQLDVPQFSSLASIHARLTEGYGVTISISRWSETSSSLRRFDEETRVLTIDGGLPLESQTFLMAHQLVRLEMAGLIEAEVEAARLRTHEARQLLTVGLSNYAAGALMMPYGVFRGQARALRHDIDALRYVFGVSFEQACHRLSTLQRPGALGIPFFFCRVDMAGNITKRHSATRLQFARFGGACPLWVVHEAVAIPDRLLIQLAEMPDGVRYISMAKGIVKTSNSYARRSRRYAVALGCEVVHAPSFVYSEQVDLTGSHTTPIGVSCRICPRSDCEQRAYPPVGSPINVDPNERGVVPYRFA